MTPETMAETALPAVPLTVEGASVLHQIMRFRRAAWRSASPAERAEAIEEATRTLAAMEQPGEGRAAAQFAASPRAAAAATSQIEEETRRAAGPRET